MILNDKTPQHFQGLAGAALLRTAGLLDVITATKLTARGGLIGTVFGQAGTGKTFAVHTAAAAVGVLACRVTFFAQTTPKTIVRTLLEELAHDTDNDNEPLLKRRLLDHLNQHPTLLVVDEAQRLTLTQLEYLRDLHDRAWELSTYEGGHPFGLLLVGGNGCAERLGSYPMLRSRVSSWIKLDRLTDQQVLELIPSFHPLYRTADPEQLLEINDDCAHGNLRDWARFTLHATITAEMLKTDTLTGEVMRLALGLFRGADS